MTFIDELESRLTGEESMFRAQLLREDVSRLRRLIELADEHDDRDEFRKAGAYIGWTSGDMRTHELTGQLTPLAGRHVRLAARRTAGSRTGASGGLGQFPYGTNAHTAALLVTPPDFSPIRIRAA